MPAGRLDVGDRVAGVLLDAGPDREDVRVDDDVLELEAGLVAQQPDRAPRDLDLAVGGVRLALLVERHDHDRGAVAATQPRVLEERPLAFLERDRVDDALALDALEAGLDDVPARRVDHHRHDADVGLAREQAQEARHRRDRVEHALVHVHVDQLGAGIDLLAGDLDGVLEPVLEDELGEPARAGDVGPLADVDEQAARLRDGQRLEAGQARARRDRRDGPRRHARDRLRDGPDVRRGRAAAAAGDVDEAVAGELRRAAPAVVAGTSS